MEVEAAACPPPSMEAMSAVSSRTRMHRRDSDFNIKAELCAADLTTQEAQSPRFANCGLQPLDGQ